LYTVLYRERGYYDVDTKRAGTDSRASTQNEHGRATIRGGRMSRAERTVTVVPEAGLHARPASKFVETVNEYDADVQIGTPDGDDFAPAGSMLTVTGLGVKSGEQVRLVADGDDAKEALDALEAVLSTPEGETEG
jgi:phosphocarrier protein